MFARTIGTISALAVLSALIASACTNATCEEKHLNCDGTGVGGHAGVGGSSAGANGGEGHGGTSGMGGGDGGAIDGAGDAGASGAAGAAPCDGACTDTTPVCKTATNTCVECTKSGDCTTPKPACDAATNTCVECTGSLNCKDSAKPFCDKAAGQCVACLKQADCTGATASACNAGVCAACTKDEECTDITGKGVCDAGTCVQCTVAKESVCSGKSCNPKTLTCTTTPVGSEDYCQPCIADSECIGGNQSDPDTRCVPMKFTGVARAGGFCLKRAAKTCAPPYEIPILSVSLSGASTETYCGINQDATRCEAVLDLVGSAACADMKDTSCGCARDKNGKCTEAGQGGLCKIVGVNLNRCTYPCGTTDDCPTGKACTGVQPYCH